MDDENLNILSASLADTGQWKLILELSGKGICAVLKNTDLEEVPLVTLFRQEWDLPGAGSLLDRIETAVYDNPRILEDFATKIIIQTPKALWIPSGYVDDEEYDTTYFTDVYPTETEDISADFGEAQTCLYTLAPGLRPFLQRTMPGSKFSCHMTILKESFLNLEKERLRGTSLMAPSAVYLNLRRGDADFFAFSHGEFLCGATRKWMETADLIYFAALACRGYGLDRKGTEIALASDEELREDLSASFAPLFHNVSFIIPERQKNDSDLSLPVLLATGANLTTEHEDNQR